MLAPFPPNTRPALLLALTIIAVLVAGCASTPPATIEERNVQMPPSPRPAAASRGPAAVPESPPAATYTVKRGDTLHQIALDNGLDYRELAAWNNIENVNRIFPGQVLRLAAPGAAPSAVRAPSAVPDAALALAQPQDGGSGVTTAPLRTVPTVAESGASVPPAAPAAPPVPSGAFPAAAAPSAATALPAVAASGSSTSSTSSSTSSTSSTSIKTSPKAIKEPYSEQAVRDLNLAASAGPAPPDALAMAAPGGARTDAKATPAPSPSAATSSRVPSAASSPALSAAVSPPSNSPSTPAVRTPPQDGASSDARDADGLDWAWPAKGKIITAFSETANLKGIDIAGTAGEAVRASAAGKVVYAGSGLRGYGKLIIIKHNATYLSAYAHNREILVKEGQQVARGQKIAEMGSTDADQVKLHFEIRRHGKPMDPAKYLPPA